MVELLGRDQSVISRHLRNLFREGELPGPGNMQKVHLASSDRPTIFYSLVRGLCLETGACSQLRPDCDAVDFSSSARRGPTQV